jgi:hypothetical protein
MLPILAAERQRTKRCERADSVAIAEEVLPAPDPLVEPRNVQRLAGERENVQAG